MGATVDFRGGGLPPMVVEGADLHGIEYELPVASAQVKSCVLLAGLLADGDTTVIEPLPSRDHTEVMLRAAGVDLGGGDGRVTVPGVRRIELETVDVPGDFSSAAFFLAAATLVPGSDILLRGVGLNPTRTAFMAILERMGGRVEVSPRTAAGGEPVGDVRVQAAELQGTEVRPAEVPLAIDELPLVALLGAFAAGRTTVHGAEELRRKESDRIETVVTGLRALGGRIEAAPDGFMIEGTGGLAGGRLDAAGDHRLAMLGAVAGVASREGVEVGDFRAAGVSYPGFAADLEALVRRVRSGAGE
jgi:3-phosphoshikimate 1-carboxyvinyltransferase